MSLLAQEEYIRKNNKRLRRGYTTGSCAAAAAKGAAVMLLGGKQTSQVELMTPKGILLKLSLEEVCREADSVS